MFAIATVTEPVGQTSPQPWTPFQRWAFRVSFVYLILDALPDLLLRMPGGPFMLRVYWYPSNAVLAWLGTHLVHDPRRFVLPTTPVLLGDFTGAYVLMLVFLLLAIIVASVWTAVDRRRTDDRALHGWLRVYVRYALAFTTMGYGVAKLFHVQFRELDLVDSLTPLGMLQPRQLLWDFMGFSRSYQTFTGVVECVGVALLFFRRTTLLGALLLAGAMTNVLMMDIAYGVSVRRIALRLLLLSVFLAAADFRRLANLFVLHRPAGPANVDGPQWRRPLARRTALAVKAIVIIGVILSMAMEYREERKIVVGAKPMLYGVFSIERAVHDGHDDVSGNPRHWTWIAIDGRSVGLAASANWERRPATFDAVQRTITLSAPGQSKDVLTYDGDGDSLTMTGTLDHQKTTLFLRRLAMPRFALFDGGAH